MSAQVLAIAIACCCYEIDPNIDLHIPNVYPCCGLQTVIQELSLCVSRNEYRFNCSGIAIYYDFLVFSETIVLTYIAIACGCQSMDAQEQYYTNFTINTLLQMRANTVRSFHQSLIQRLINKIAMELDVPETRDNIYKIKN